MTIVEVLDDPEATIPDVEIKADNWTEARKAKRLQSTGRKDGNSFDTVGTVKRKTDTKDECYIYRINNSNCNDGCNYVFKSSRKMVELALKMDIDGDQNIMQTENAYFNATHSRVHGFKSFGLWVYHLSMRRINPKTVICDEGGANHKAIRMIYGEDFTTSRVVGCTWHFQNDATRIAKCIGPDMQQVFTTLIKDFCHMTTVCKYKILKSKLDEVAKLYPNIESWIDWWQERQNHIFTPFRGGGLPGVNLSEQGNAGWKRHMMSLVRAAKDDFATMVLQERCMQMHMFNNNLQASDGRGPSQSKLRAKQEREADEFVDILDDDYAIILEAIQSENPEYNCPKLLKNRPKKINRSLIAQ